ncbi:MAG: AMP-binding protein, partial [Deltaproteobacteria bacterium]|nr:AMP-binding protein [Deltaproteobacteria bacterium]
MKIRLWKGYHSQGLRSLLAQTWSASSNDEMLIACPPFLKDLDFVRQLPAGEIEFCGEWAGLEIERKAGESRSYAEPPVLGVFTSGTVSGVARLVLYSRANIESSLDAILALFERSRIETVFCYPQPFHTFGLILGYALPMLRDFQLVTGQGRYSRSFHELRAAQRNERLLTLGTPTHFHDLLSYVREAGIELAPSYSSIVGGAMVSVAQWRAIRDFLHVQAPSIGYGATEASPGVSHLPPGREPLEDGEIGFAFPHLSVALHAGRGLEFSGRSLCLAMIQDGRLEFPKSVLLTDDVRQRDDGRLVYQGRTELILNRGGQKYSL